MPWSADTRCLYCDAKLALYRKLTNGQFCSSAHRKSYWSEQERLAVERLHQTHDSLQAYRPAQGVEAILGKPVHDPYSDPYSMDAAIVAAPPEVAQDFEEIEELARTASNKGDVVTAGFLPDKRMEAVAAYTTLQSSVDSLPEWNTLTVDFLHAGMLEPAACALPVAEAVDSQVLFTGAAPSGIHPNPAGEFWGFDLQESVALVPSLNAAHVARGLPGADALRIFVPSINWRADMSPAVAAAFKPVDPHNGFAVLYSPLTPELTKEAADRSIEAVLLAEAQALAEVHARAEAQAIAEAAALAAAQALAAEQARLEEQERLWAEMLAEEKRLAEEAALAAAAAEEASTPPHAGLVLLPHFETRTTILPSVSALSLHALAVAESLPAENTTSAEIPTLVCAAAHGFNLPAAASVPMPATVSADAGRHAARAGLLEFSSVPLLLETSTLLNLSAFAADAAPLMAGGRRYPVSQHAGSLAPIADAQPSTPIPDVQVKELPLVTDAEPARGSGFAPLVRMALRGAILPSDNGPVSNLEMQARGVDDAILPVLSLKPIEGVATPPIKMSLLHPATWMPSSVTEPRELLQHAGEFWRHAPRDLKMLAVAIPILLGLVLHSSMPKVRVSAPTANSGLQSNLQKGFERRMREQFQQVRRSVAERAAVALNEDFRAGLDDWQTPGDLSTAWSFDHSGFVKPGVLALYRPSLGLTDYETQFLGMIDKKALSFVARAKDFKNYYVVKLVVTRPGPMPTLGITRYAVIDGKPQDRVDTIAEISVQKDTLYRATLNVHGDTFLLALQGKIVDSWSDARLTRGGIGFFSARGEESRLRWVQVTHQYDMLGRLCAYLAPQNIPTTDGSW